MYYLINTKHEQNVNKLEILLYIKYCISCINYAICDSLCNIYKSNM